MDRKIGFIGAGNIGSTMISAMVKSGFTKASNIYAVNNNHKEKLKQLQNETGISICENNVELVDKSDIIVMAVKPQSIKNVTEEIKEHFGNRLLITIAAGIPVKVFEDILGTGRRIFRAMPNLPLLVGEGMTIITYNAGMDNADIKYVKSLFEEFGRVEEMDESLLSTVISLTASSPAYVFMLIESLAASAVKMGLPISLAYKISAQTVLGSAKMYLEEQKDLNSSMHSLDRNMELLADTSGLFNEDRIRSAIAEAMDVCNKKAWEFEKI